MLEKHPFSRGHKGVPIIHSLRDQTPPLCDSWLEHFPYTSRRLPNLRFGRHPGPGRPTEPKRRYLLGALKALEHNNHLRVVFRFPDAPFTARLVPNQTLYRDWLRRSGPLTSSENGSCYPQTTPRPHLPAWFHYTLGLQSYLLRRWDWGCQEGPVIPNLRRYENGALGALNGSGRVVRFPKAVFL